MLPNPCPTTPPSPVYQHLRIPFWRGLSARLLLLTIIFVMIAEVLIFAPSVGRYRLVWMDERLGAAHLALLAVEAHPDGMVDTALQQELLSHAGALGLRAWRPDRPMLALGPHAPVVVEETYHIDDRPFLPMVAQAFSALVRTESRIIAVRGASPRDETVSIEAVLEEAPMIARMRGFGWRILTLSLMISLITASLVYLALHWLLVRPLQRMSASMLTFSAAPEDARHILTPSARRDEVGVAERVLAEMQADLRSALRQKARLAAVGTAVAKINHDLKGVLTSALLESDRLEATAKAEERAVTQGIARALERAIGLCGSTLDFAAQGLPEVRLTTVSLSALIEDARRQTNGRLAWTLAPPNRDQSLTADPALLLRVFENLGRNAAEAGATTLTITPEPTPHGGLRLLLRDNGTGLPAKARANLFVPFSGSARPGGIGLGLPIAHELAAAQGISLSLRSSGPEGTCFALEFQSQ